MPSQRQIGAYRRRLDRIVEQGACALTSECIGAVASVTGLDEDLTAHSSVGTIVSFTHRQAHGLLGPRLVTDVVLCPACVLEQGDCAATPPIRLTDVILYDLIRNAPGEELRHA